jgi:hypothetical protein
MRRPTPPLGGTSLIRLGSHPRPDPPRSEPRFQAIARDLRSSLTGPVA